MRTTAGLGLGLLLTLGAVAGCGGGSDDDGTRIASAGKPTATAPASPGGKGTGNGKGAGKDTGDARDAMLRYAQCMRENGIPGFPDPTFNGEGGVSLDLPEGTDAKAVEAAQVKCRSLMPNGGENQKVDPKVTEQLRRYAQCMRENGIPQFPDPSADGGLQINNDALGLRPDDPRFKSADQACSTYMPKPPGGDGGRKTSGPGAGA
ncbi:hypothetical protein [Embleya sp. NPDC050493]|uniref:hypothetical protein n=1 Tax=Embleya sp. NPDC050493 TaxID=3363989 RepID=UPI0037AA0063